MSKIKYDWPFKDMEVGQVMYYRRANKSEIEFSEKAKKEVRTYVNRSKVRKKGRKKSFTATLATRHGVEYMRIERVS